MTDYFQFAVDGARRRRDDVVREHAIQGVDRHRPSSVIVEERIGSVTIPRAVADVFLGDTLTITSVDDWTPVREFPAGTWRRADVLAADGYPLYTLTAHTPVDAPLDCVPCPVCPAKAWKRAVGPEGITEYLCNQGHQLFVVPPAARRSA